MTVWFDAPRREEHDAPSNTLVFVAKRFQNQEIARWEPLCAAQDGEMAYAGEG